MIFTDRLKYILIKNEVEFYNPDGRTPVSILRNKYSPTLSLLFCFRDGVAYEPEDLWGVSHFVEHILFRGTEEIPTLYDISRMVEGSGGQISAYSTRDMTAFRIKTIPGNEARALYVIDQLLNHPALDEEFINSEKIIIQQERLRELNNPSFLSSMMIESLLLLPAPISRHPVGSAESIEKINSALLLKYVNTTYTRDNLAIAAAGSLSDDFIKNIEVLLAGFRDGKPSMPAGFAISSPAADAPVAILPSHNKSQVFLSLGWKFVIEKELDFFIWRVINSLFGSGYTSLLNRILRERENITYICTTGMNFYGDTAIFKINLALSDKNLEKALDLINGLIEDLKEGRIDPDVFGEAKTRHAAGLIFRLEDSLETAKIMGHSMIREWKPFSFGDYINQLERVTVPLAAEAALKNLKSENRKIFIQTGSEDIINKFSRALILERNPDGSMKY